MKKESNYWYLALSFLSGSLISFVLTQFEYFKIDPQINVVETLISIITAVIGLYIAISIQKKITKSQNQYSYIQLKLDNLWSSFNVFAQLFNYDDKIELSVLTKFNKDCYQSISFLKSIYSAYELDDNCLIELENNIEQFETFICSLPVSSNIYSLIGKEVEINISIISISKCFSTILKEIHNS